MDHLQQLIDRYPALAPLEKNISAAFTVLKECFERGGKLLIAGNGGSAADAEHIAGELMKGFVKKRSVPPEFTEKMKKIDPENGGTVAERLQGALPAIALSGHAALNFAVINDTAGEMTFAQQVYGYGNPGDVFLGITTSGNSKNILAAAASAKAKGLKIISLTGEGGGKIKQYSDVCVNVPGTETFKIQELHLPVYHALCLILEEYFFP